ncbi:MAG TPA: hypothetical protein VJZ01_09090 [Lachnospiraceae bacterium]|nr:hypothetical protein [Lachnospiraceae bacterium]
MKDVRHSSKWYEKTVAIRALSVPAGEALYKPSAYESEIHPSHKLCLYSGYFALLGADSPTTGMSL